MTSLSQADFEARLEAVFHQNTGESQQIAQDIDQSVDLLSLSEEMPANEDLLNEDSAAPVIRLINAILSEAIKETASDIHIETYEKQCRSVFASTAFCGQFYSQTKTGGTAYLPN